MNTPLFCPVCNTNLETKKEPAGYTKNGKPSKKRISILICPKCGKKWT